jgi:hypothetical protein
MMILKALKARNSYGELVTSLANEFVFYVQGQVFCF